MVRCHLKEVMHRRGITSAAKLSRLADLNEKTVGAIVREEAQGIDYSTLNKLCRVLECRPGDLLEYTPD